MNLPGVSAGFIGVDIFLVVSGYVITLSIQKKPARRVFRNLVEFWRSRFIRIFPAAALVIAVTVVAAFYLSGKAFNSDLFADARWATLYATNLRLINTGSNYFIAGLDQSLLTHYWSLAVEQQFYLVYPLALFLLTWLGTEKNRKLVLRVFLVVVICLSSYWSITQTILDPVASYFSPLTRFWELAFGGLLATFTIRQSKFIPYLGLGLLVASMFVLNAQSSYPGFLAWLPVLGTGILLASPLKPLGFTPLRYLGDISYSLYLWHFIWLVLPTQIENPITDPNMVWLFLLGAIASAVITYHLFEKPIHRSVTLKTDTYSATVLAAVCLLGAWLVISLIENLYLRSIL